MEERSKMKVLKTVIKIILVSMAGFALVLLLLYGVGIYFLNYAVSTVDESTSPDGKYTLQLQSIGSPIFFSSADGRLVLKRAKKGKEKNSKIASYRFVLADDGGSIRPEIWNVAWEKEYVSVTISGEEQEDQIITIKYDGQTYSQYSRETAKKETNSDTQGENKKAEAGIKNNQEENEEAENEKTENERKESTEFLIQQRILDGYKAIYDSKFKKENYSFEEDYDAKGNSRIILYEDDTEIKYFAYDRESNNEKCGLYVYYSSQKNEDGSWSPMEASILDIYAYVYEKKKVISSGKTYWGETASAEYQEATGEY